jgi:hypothetical protein
MQEFQVLRVFEPALRMKAQADSNSRGQKDFICREEKDCILESFCILETSDPMGQGGEWGFIAFLHCLMVEMSFRCKGRSVSLTSCGLSFNLSCQQYMEVDNHREKQTIFLVTCL